MNQFTQLAHPSLLPIFGYNFIDFDQEPRLSLLTEYLSNGSLENYIYLGSNSLNSLSPTEKLINIYGIASGMCYLHSLDILHKNLKPSNILETRKKWPKIADFNSKLTDQISIENTEFPIYTPPEIWKGEEYTKSSDVYSFAIIVYEIMTNKKPFENLSPFQFLTSIIQGNRPTFLANFPETYRKLIEKCWSSNPSERPNFSQIIDLIRNDDQFITEISADKEQFHQYISLLDNHVQMPKETYISKTEYHITEGIYRDVFDKSVNDIEREEIEIERDRIECSREDIENARKLIEIKREIIEELIESNLNKISSQNLMFLKHQKEKIQKEIISIKQEKELIEKQINFIIQQREAIEQSDFDQERFLIENEKFHICDEIFTIDNEIFDIEKEGEIIENEKINIEQQKESNEQEIMITNIKQTIEEIKKEKELLKHEIESIEKIRQNLEIEIKQFYQPFHLKPLNISSYEPKIKIGEGSFGKAHKIIDKTTGSIYVAKISKNEITDFDSKIDKDAINFLREVNIISSLNHPSILKFIGYSLSNFKSQPKPVIITEFVSKGSLNEILELEDHSIANQNWDNTKKLINIYGIASAMLYLHKHNILHLDLKASNILVDENFYPKLSDFGLSKDLIEKEDNSNLFFKGTPTHAAPEIWRNSEYSKASDVYAFGLTVFEIMTNDTPFKNVKGIYNIIHEVCVLGNRPQFIHPIPNRYRKLIEDCWTSDPKNRPSFDEIVCSLKNDSAFIIEAAIDEKEFFDYVELIDGCQISEMNFQNVERKNKIESTFNNQNNSEKIIEDGKIIENDSNS